MEVFNNMLSARVNIKRRPSQPAKIDRYLVSGSSSETMTTTKSSSLPGHAGHSPTLLDPLAVPPEDLASQLTLLDLPVFRKEMELACILL